MVQAPLVQYGGDVERKVPGWHSTDNTLQRLLERHFPKRIPPTERKSVPTKKCVVCYKNNKKETVFWCPDYEANLCVEGCFKTYHTKLKSIPFIKTSVHNKYSPKVSLKSFNYWGNNVLLKQI
jgi:hypothetical protein